MSEAHRFRVLLVDDESAANLALRALLKRHADVTVIGEAEGGREAITAIRELVPDLVFLDVQMPKVDGFDVVRTVGPAQMPPVVFVTAHDEFAVRAFEVQAVDYLLKPVAARRLDQALTRVRDQSVHQLATMGLAERFRALLTEVGERGTGTTREPAGRLLVRLGAREIVVAAAEIEWLEADDNRVVVHGRGVQYETRGSLAEILARLDAPEFVRIHRSVVVHASQVREVQRNAWGGVHLVLADGTRLPVSRRHRAAVLARLGG